MNIGNQHDCMSHLASRKALVDKLSAELPYATHMCVCNVYAAYTLEPFIESNQTEPNRAASKVHLVHSVKCVLHIVLYDDICYLLIKHDTFKYSACT